MCCIKGGKGKCVPFCMLNIWMGQKVLIMGKLSNGEGIVSVLNVGGCG